MQVIADTGPLHYLVLIDQIGLLGPLFGRVIIPVAVRDELDHSETPAPVRAWITAPPPWLSIMPPPDTGKDAVGAALDNGERAVIALACHVRPDLILMDDRAGATSGSFRYVPLSGC